MKVIHLSRCGVTVIAEGGVAWRGGSAMWCGAATLRRGTEAESDGRSVLNGVARRRTVVGRGALEMAAQQFHFFFYLF
ncbi:hypothetical protein SESBI_25070 [Sesbania bispinosa]|nr:hypothetical protein SESBI_25070 [Sesbania bispinosa]